MSDTYTGTIDPSLSLTSQLGQVFPNDRQGTLVQISSLGGATVDNIFYFNGPSGTYLKRVINGPIRAAECGIYANGSDMSTPLQAALDHDGITTLIFDFAVEGSTGAEITINSAITVPAGKVLEFKTGNKIKGTGSITGGIIDAPDTQMCFNKAFAVYPEGSAKSYYNMKWFGAGDGTNPPYDDVVIQRMIDYLQANYPKAKPLYFPRGTYVLDKGLLIYRYSSNDYQQCTLEMFGEWDARSGIQEPITKFTCTSNMANDFMLGIQRGRVVTIRNIMFTGLYSLPTTFSFLDVFRKTASQWLQTSPATIRDNTYSPHCCINIDPFSRTQPNIGGNPAGYPDWTSYYHGTTDGGSSQIVLHGCRFEQTPVGVACSINADTTQAEIIKIEQCSFAYHKAAYALGQPQTKENLMIDIRAWNSIRTVIECYEYGGQQGGPPYIEGMNIAGGVYQLINANGPFSLYASKVFGELLFRIGKLGSSANVHSITQSDIDFGAGTSGFPSADYIVSGAINFVNCSIRYYDGGFQRLKLCPPNTVAISITGGTISRVPLTSSISAAGDAKYINLGNVKSYGENHTLLLGNDNAQVIGFNLLKNTPLCGNVKTFNAAGSDGTLFFSYEKNTYDAIEPLETATVTVNNDGTASVVLSAASLARIVENDYLISSAAAGLNYWEEATVDPMPVLGRITNINAGTGTVTLSGAAINIPVGSTALPILVNYIRHFNAPIVGNITNGSNTITSCEFFSGFTPNVGMRLEHPRIPTGLYITNVNAGAGTITLSGNATDTLNDVTFLNGSPKIQHRLNFSPAVSSVKGFLIEGAEITVDRTTIYSSSGDRYYVKKSVLSASSSRPVQYFPSTGGYQRINIATLRFGAGPTDTNTSYFITDTGREGLFILDPSDTTTADNGATVLVANTGRFKRVLTNNFYNGRWFGKSNIYFDSVSDANTNITSAYRFKSLTVLINFSGIIKEYWYYNGVADADLVLKTQNELDVFSSGSDTSRSVAANVMTTYILVKPSSNLAGFKVGTSSGASDVVATQAVNSGAWKVFNAAAFFESAGSLFFGGITASTDIKIVKILLQ